MVEKIEHNIIRRFFWLCSGATIPLLQTPECLIEHNKYVGIGATVFFTGILAAISAAYALYTVFDSLPAAISFGILWGLMIFNLDRFIVSNIKKKEIDLSLFVERTKREIFVEKVKIKVAEIFNASPRLLLAILLSIVITKPLELRIFKSEIKNYLADKNIINENVQDEELKKRFNEIAYYESESKRLASLIEQLQKTTDEATKNALKEKDGLGVTKQPGAGKVYDQRIEEYKTNSKRLQEAIDQKKANEDLLINARKKKDKASEKLIREKDKIDSLVSQLVALSELTATNQVHRNINYFLLLLFALLETSPILVKIFSSYGPYDQIFEVEEERAKQLKKQQVEQLIEETKVDLEITKLQLKTSLEVEKRLYQELKDNFTVVAATDIKTVQSDISRRVITNWHKKEINKTNKLTK